MPNDTKDYQTILNSVEPYSEPEGSFRILYGPYAGTVFAYTAFNIGDETGADGMVPASYETEVYTLAPDMRLDEAWDQWTSDLLEAILFSAAKVAPEVH